MTGLSMVRMISRVGVRLMVRQGGGGHSTDGLQDKSRSLWPARPAADGRKIKGLARCSLYTTACISELHEQHQARLHIARWRHHEPRR